MPIMPRTTCWNLSLADILDLQRTFFRKRVLTDAGYRFATKRGSALRQHIP